jgi:hypothetical protein
MAVRLRYGLGDRVELARIAVQLAQLDELDDIWTAYLDEADPSDIEHDRDELVALANALHESILAATGGMARLVAILESLSEDAIDDAFGAIRDRHPDLMNDFDNRLAEVLAEYSYRGMLIDACQLLRDELPEEAADVVEKRSQFMQGGTPLGDLKPWRKCALNVAVVGLGIAGIVMTGGAASGLIVSSASQIVSFGVTWEDGCSHVASRIWRRLRD